jgi:hypothetical protein
VPGRTRARRAQHLGMATRDLAASRTLHFAVGSRAVAINRCPQPSLRIAALASSRASRRDPESQWNTHTVSSRLVDPVHLEVAPLAVPRGTWPGLPLQLVDGTGYSAE